MGVPAKAKSLNQVWQVGPTVHPETGAPEIIPANLHAKSVLVFHMEGGVGLPPRAHGSASPASAPAGSSDKAGVAVIGNAISGSVVGLYVFIYRDILLKLTL